MKIYIVSHTGSPQWYKLEAFSDVEKVGENGIHVKSVKAFTKKKYAKDWIKKNNCEHLEVKTAIIQ